MSRYPERLHLVVLPGGAYQRHAPHEGEPVADWLRGLGYGASVFAYPLSARHPAALVAVQDEVARLRASGLLRVGLVGFSAGGHAAALATVRARPDARVDACILGYPVITTRPELPTRSRRVLIGDPPVEADEHATSADEHVSPDTPPCFIWHTADDEVVPVEHSYRLAIALARAGIRHELHVYPHGAHGLGLAEHHPGTAEWTRTCERWLAALDPREPAPEVPDIAVF